MKPRFVLRALLYFGPLALFALIFLVWSSGERGRYETTWHLITRTLAFLCPEQTPQEGSDPVQVSLYQLNGALRRLAHIGGYSILTALIVRAVQGGQARLKPASFIAALMVSILYTGLDELRRAFEPNRHAKWHDLYLNLIGVGLTLGGTLLFFGIKSLERRVGTAIEPEKP